MGSLLLNGIQYPVLAYKPGGGGFAREPLAEYASSIREGQARRVDRQFADFRVDEAWPLGLGYKRGPWDRVGGGIWTSELRHDIDGQLTLPLIMQSQSVNLGDLSGEVAAAGRICSISTDLGNTSGLSRTYVGVGTKLLRTVSDTDFTLEDSTWTIPTGSARIYCMAEITLNNTRRLALGLEDPTTGTASAFIVTTDPTATPPVFTDVEEDNTASGGRADNVYWLAAHDSRQRVYAHIRSNDQSVYNWTNEEVVIYWTYGGALSQTPTNPDAFVPRQGSQCAGIIGDRIWVIMPEADAQANPNTVRRLAYIDIAQGHRLTRLRGLTRTVVAACLYRHPTFGSGVAYTDGKQVCWVDEGGGSHVNLGWFRHQGRNVACSVRGFSVAGQQLLVLVQRDSNAAAWWEMYVPKANQWGGSWYPMGKRVTTTAQVILPGGTPRGSTFPYGAEGLRHYFIEPSATNSVIWRQKQYAYLSNPLVDSVAVDDFEDGVLNADLPLTDPWGGAEEQGTLISAYLEGDENVVTAETVALSYTTDMTTYTSMGAALTAADTSVTVAAGGAAVRRFGTRIGLDRGSTTTKTPNGAPVIWRGLKEPARRPVHEFWLDVNAMGANEWRLLRARLETAGDKNPPPLLEYGNISVYVYIIGWRITGDLGDNPSAPEKPMTCYLKMVEVT